ncbi:hypothetical protein [Bosea psychrotolerans]|uniref:hypothetical protein n=1 Tax=Bosea psychrotolerans TaxID=1871628 RepID=UPI0011B0740C|nr:hypothetical protein [Bosea psychrotolerans]
MAPNAATPRAIAATVWAIRGLTRVKRDCVNETVKDEMSVAMKSGLRNDRLRSGAMAAIIVGHSRNGP